ncbi:MAG: cytochrome c nitrite reductase small subunit [Myxococcota bacterium]|nr:cytochrome c nitrite reductase small subunit [Deltaproteobacteria bacterium]MDQ3336336.1 cytochrome c nitrite reductase small subunit [Myxococcota bacterium]
MRARTVSIVAIVLAVTVGVAIGLGVFTFVYARGASYLGNDPASCANCHVMDAHYAAWQKASHHHVAGCNDCHAPPSGPAKYWVKAVNGYYHSYAFTTGDFVEPLRITERNRRVTEAQCRHCHAELVQTMGHVADISCIRCHESVGHRVGD